MISEVGTWRSWRVTRVIPCLQERLVPAVSTAVSLRTWSSPGHRDTTQIYYPPASCFHQKQLPFAAATPLPEKSGTASSGVSSLWRPLPLLPPPPMIPLGSQGCISCSGVTGVLRLLGSVTHRQVQMVLRNTWLRGCHSSEPAANWWSAGCPQSILLGSSQQEGLTREEASQLPCPTFWDNTGATNWVLHGLFAENWLHGTYQ